jgi:hypothetical protein
MLYQLSYASPDSLIPLFPKTPRRPLEEAYRMKGYHTPRRFAMRCPEIRKQSLLHARRNAV